MLIDLIFYLFSAVMVGSALLVITVKNPVHSVLFLILAFFNSAGIFLLLGAEFIAMLMVIVYVGAVAVLFLFVVMMLDINYVKLRQGFMKYLPIGALVAVLLLTEIILVLRASLDSMPVPSEYVASGLTNTERIGHVLYTDYAYPFQLAGIILLIAMIGAIVLTLRKRPDVRRQKISDQIARKGSESVTMVEVKPGQGA